MSMHAATDRNDFIPYPEIGHGAQFKAFDMHNGRVLKIPLTEAETYAVARNRRNTAGDQSEQTERLPERVQTFINGKARIPAMITHRLADDQHFLQLLGNPKLIKDYLPEDTPSKRWGAGRVTYSQDKMLMTHDVLNRMAGYKLDRVALHRLRQMIDAFVVSTHQLWEYGFADYVFKFGDTGFDSQGTLHFVDLGECTSDLEFMLMAVEQRRWRNNIDQSKTDFPQLPPEVHEYFMSSLEKAFSPNMLQKLWKKKHDCNECLRQDDIMNSFITAKVAEIDYIDRW
jgi:hypothetical protein